MRSILKTATLLVATILAPSAVVAVANVTNAQSQQILSSTFAPPQYFRNINLVKNINLQKGYPKEIINVLIENISPTAQDEYYLPFEGSVIGRVGGMEVRDKSDGTKPAFAVEIVEYDTHR